jgi:hypothetical protein
VDPTLDDAELDEREDEDDQEQHECLSLAKPNWKFTKPSR